MTKRSDLIRKSVIRTIGMATGSIVFNCNSQTSAPIVDFKVQNDCQSNPEWYKIDWGVP